MFYPHLRLFGDANNEKRWSRKLRRIILLQIGTRKSRFHYFKSRPNSMISWFLTPPPRPKTNIMHLWRHQGTSNKSRKIYGFSFNTFFINVNILETHIFFRKDRHRKMMKIQVIKYPKSWICISYLSKSMKWQFGNM